MVHNVDLLLFYKKTSSSLQFQQYIIKMSSNCLSSSKSSFCFPSLLHNRHLILTYIDLNNFFQILAFHLIIFLDFQTQAVLYHPSLLHLLFPLIFFYFTFILVARYLLGQWPPFRGPFCI